MLSTWLLKIGVLLFRTPRFRKWAELEDRKYSAIKAVEQDSLDFPKLISEYIYTALPIHVKYDGIFWQDEIDAFLRIHSVTLPKTNLPLVIKPSEHKEKKDPWDYSGRLWYFYSHIIANAYGWNVRQIAGLPILSALAYVQEIMTEQQLDSEFQRSLSEMSYSYSKQTKKSTLIKAPRPYWMLPDISNEPPPKIKIRKSLLPVGNVIRLEDESKKTKSE